MTIIEKIKEFCFFNFAIKKNKNKTTQAFSLQNAKTVGIIFNGEIIEDNQKINQFLKILVSQNKEVQLLAFVPIPALSAIYNFSLITTNDLNWYNQPKNSSANNFINKEFDLLINFSTEKCLPLTYVMANSNAKFKICFDEDADTNHYDFLLLANEKNKIDSLILLLEKYLS